MPTEVYRINRDNHEHGQKLLGTLFKKSLRGALKFPKLLPLIWDNHRGFKNQPQNLIKNLQNFFHFPPDFAFFPKIFLKIIRQNF